VLAAAKLNAERVAAEPHNARAKLDYTSDLGALGDYHLARREYPEALGHFQNALALRRELWEADRVNAFAWNRMAYMLTRVGETHALAGEPGLAAPFLREAVEHAQRLPDQEQHWVVTTLARAYLGLGDVERASRRSPCAWYGKMAPCWARCRTRPSTSQGEAAGRLEQARQRLQACPYSK
jgi:tetratricopeptide (TPR) repeat protein